MGAGWDCNRDFQLLRAAPVTEAPALAGWCDSGTATTPEPFGEDPPVSSSPPHGAMRTGDRRAWKGVRKVTYK